MANHAGEGPRRKFLSDLHRIARLARALAFQSTLPCIRKNEKVDIAAGRAYYAMFFTAEALLNELFFSTCREMVRI